MRPAPPEDVPPSVALARVALADPIERGFPSRNVGARTPDAAFVKAALERVRAEAAGDQGPGRASGPASAPPLAAAQIVTVGDS